MSMLQFHVSVNANSSLGIHIGVFSAAAKAATTFFSPRTGAVRSMSAREARVMNHQSRVDFPDGIVRG